jgi:hypothetical protein
MSFETKTTELEGGFSAKDLPVIEKLLQAPKSNRKDFASISPTRDLSQIKADISTVNDLVYDDKTLEKEINARLDIIEKSLTEDLKKAEATYQEREKYWKTEIENKNELLQKRLKEREAQLDKEIAALEKETEKKIDENLVKFKEGVAKNIRKDEKPLEKSIQVLEKLVSSKTDQDLVSKIEQELIKLSDFTQIFAEAVGFAKQQVGILKEKEQDILDIKELDIEKLKRQAEIDKEALRDESKRKEKERDTELKELKVARDEKQKVVSQFKDVRSEWVSQIKQGIGSQDTAMINKRFIPTTDAGNYPKSVDLQVPLYLFQYKKENETYTLAIPPINMPDNMKKPDRSSFYGDHRTVFYDLVVPETERMIVDWFLEASKSLELNSSIQQLDNLLDNPAGIRDTFFTSRGLMVDKLKVNQKNFSKANDRLTDVFTSG